MTTTTLPVDPETEQLALKIAQVTGKAVPTILREAVRAYEANLRLLGPKSGRKKTPQEIDAAFQRAITRIAALPVLDPRTPDEIIGYDDFGLPQ